MALETSGNSASVAVFDDGQLLVTGDSDPHVRTAAGLVPLVRDVLGRAGRSLSDVKLISLPVGPGSFTGLRVGVTTAKTLAYALGCDVLGLDTLEVIAAQSPGDAHELWTVVDAQRQQLFARKLRREGSSWSPVADATIIDNEAFFAQLAPGAMISGSGLLRTKAMIPSHVVALDESCWMPRAETVGRLAHEKYLAGERGDLWQLVPQYFRPSAAEEKRAMAQ